MISLLTDFGWGRYKKVEDKMTFKIVYSDRKSEEGWNTYAGNIGKEPDARWYNQMFGKIYITIDKINERLKKSKLEKGVETNN